MLLSLGDLTADELAARTTATPTWRPSADDLVRRATRARGPHRRADALHRRRRRGAISRRPRRAAAGRRPRGAARARAGSARQPGEALRAHARAVWPPTSSPPGTRSARPSRRSTLVRLAGDGQLVEGEFTPGGTGREWTDAGVLRQLRRRSLARLRHEIEPVEQAGPRTARRRAGRASPGAGTAPMRCSTPSSSSGRAAAGVHPRNRDPSRPGSTRTIPPISTPSRRPAKSSGRVSSRWARGDGRIALYLADQLPRLLPPQGPVKTDQPDA